MRKAAALAVVALLAGCLSPEEPAPPAAPAEEAAPEKELKVLPLSGDFSYESLAEVQACPAHRQRVWGRQEGFVIDTPGLVGVDVAIAWQPTDPAFTRMGFWFHTFEKGSGVGAPMPTPTTEGVSPVRWVLGASDFEEIRERGIGTTAIMADSPLCHQENTGPLVNGRQMFHVTGNATYEA